MKSEDTIYIMEWTPEEKEAVLQQLNYYVDNLLEDKEVQSGKFSFETSCGYAKLNTHTVLSLAIQIENSIVSGTRGFFNKTPVYRVELNAGEFFHLRSIYLNLCTWYNYHIKEGSGDTRYLQSMLQMLADKVKCYVQPDEKRRKTEREALLQREFEKAQ